MGSPLFKQYVGPANIHDGTIERVERAGERLEVKVRSYEGQLIHAVFDGVSEVTANRPEGMMLYALAEYESQGNDRSFVFVNWDDDDAAELRIVAQDVRLQ